MKTPIAAMAVAASVAVLSSAQAADKDIVEALYSQVLSSTASPILPRVWKQSCHRTGKVLVTTQVR